MDTENVWTFASLSSASKIRGGQDFISASTILVSIFEPLIALRTRFWLPPELFNTATFNASKDGGIEFLLEATTIPIIV